MKIKQKKILHLTKKLTFSNWIEFEAEEKARQFGIKEGLKICLGQNIGKE